MNSEQKSGGIGYVGALLLIFITLKLCGVIDWSWWWVLSPIWITTVIILLIALIVCVVKHNRDREVE